MRFEQHCSRMSFWWSAQVELCGKLAVLCIFGVLVLRRLLERLVVGEQAGSRLEEQKYVNSLLHVVALNILVINQADMHDDDYNADCK